MAILIHIPTWGWTYRGMNIFFFIEFQPTPLQGGWTSYYQLKGNHNLFQPTSSTWGMNGFVVFTNQSYDNITTHIPVWGWTGNYLKLIVYGVYISIHTPVWGWTFSSRLDSAKRWFQPTPPHGDEQARPFRSGPFFIHFNPHPRMGMNRR